MNNKKLYCVNCGKCGHNLKECTEPVYSYGIICMKIDDNILNSPFEIENYLINKIINIDEFNFSNLSNLSKFDYYKNKIKFLLIQRKHSFSYVEFIRGKYDEKNFENIKTLLTLMALNEIESIINNTNFNILWNNLWQKTSKSKIYQKEFEISQKKFEYIKKNYDLPGLINYNKIYLTPEWGFPKGRRDKNEKNIDCAIREFEEETGINQDKYILLNRLNTIEEAVFGTNNTLYKLVYYFGLSFEEYKLEINNEHQKYEIGDMKWLTYEELLSKFREYEDEKIMMIHKVYFMILNLLENVKYVQVFSE